MKSGLAIPSSTVLRNRTKAGRIGFEFDTSGISCVQAEKSNSGWRPVLHRNLARAGHTIGSNYSQLPENGSEMTVANAADLLMLTGGMKNATAACVLPMELCELRVLHLPEAAPEDMRLMVQGELESVGVRDPIFDYWTIPSDYSTQRNLTTVNVIVANPFAVRQAAALLQEAGLSLTAIDSIPTAAARAISLMQSVAISESQSDQASLADLASFELIDHEVTSSQPVMVVHIGWLRCMYSLVSRGVPVLTRVPTQSGLRSLVESSTQALRLSPIQLLAIMRGLAEELPVHPSGRVLRHLVDQIRKWAAPVAEEILRSVAYSGRPGLRMMPVDVILLGPGCIVPGLAEILTQEVNIHTTMWSMRDTCGRFVSGESAIPFAMSALEVTA